jgi:hypothetical protein
MITFVHILFSLSLQDKQNNINANLNSVNIANDIKVKSEILKDLYQLSLFNSKNKINFLEKHSNSNTNKHFKGLIKVKNYTMNPNDLLTYSNTQEALQTKMIFNLFLNFNKQIIEGKVKIFFKCLKPTNKFALDFKDLEIFGIKNNQGKNLDYKFIKNLNISHNLGLGLIIDLGENCKINNDKNNFVEIKYASTKESVALHFSNRIML